MQQTIALTVNGERRAVKTEPNRPLLDVLREARLFQVHDVLAATRSRTDEDHATNDRRSVLGHLLRDHTAEGEAENVAGRDT